MELDALASLPRMARGWSDLVSCAATRHNARARPVARRLRWPRSSATIVAGAATED